MLPLYPRSGPCQVIGHRGASGYAPENTLISFDEAVRRGADWIEMDVRLSRDGEVIVLHDETLERTTNGTGEAAAKDWAEIRKLDAGTWFKPEFKEERIPRLAEVFSRFQSATTVRGEPVGFMVELKIDAVSRKRLVRVTGDALRQSGLGDRCAVISFDLEALMDLRTAFPGVFMGYLYDDQRKPVFECVQGCGINAICPHKRCVNETLVKEAHDRGLAVTTWTADTEEEMRRMATSGVDAVATNYPDRLRAILC